MAQHTSAPQSPTGTTACRQWPLLPYKRQLYGALVRPVFMGRFPTGLWYTGSANRRTFSIFVLKELPSKTVWKKAFFPLPLGERLCSPLVFRVYCFGSLLSSKLPVFLVLCALFWVFYATSMQNNAFGCINLQHSPRRYRRGLCAFFCYSPGCSASRLCAARRPPMKLR